MPDPVEEEKQRSADTVASDSWWCGCAQGSAATQWHVLMHLDYAAKTLEVTATNTRATYNGAVFLESRKAGQCAEDGTIARIERVDEKVRVIRQALEDEGDGEDGDEGEDKGTHLAAILRVVDSVGRGGVKQLRISQRWNAGVMNEHLGLTYDVDIVSIDLKRRAHEQKSNRFIQEVFTQLQEGRVEERRITRAIKVMHARIDDIDVAQRVLDKHAAAHDSTATFLRALNRFKSEQKQAQQRGGQDPRKDKNIVQNKT